MRLIHLTPRLGQAARTFKAVKFAYNLWQAVLFILDLSWCCSIIRFGRPEAFNNAKVLRQSVIKCQQRSSSPKSSRFRIRVIIHLMDPLHRNQAYVVATPVNVCNFSVGMYHFREYLIKILEIRLVVQCRKMKSASMLPYIHA